MMKFKHTIDSEGVKGFCIYNKLYTRGDTVDFDFRELLDSVNELHNCTPQDIINIANDIVEHSDAQDAKIYVSVENIVYYLCGDVMFTEIEIDDWQGKGTQVPFSFFLNYKIEILFLFSTSDVLNKS